MATYLLTPKAADPVTGLTKSLLGWQLTAATSADVEEGIDIIATQGYLGVLSDPNQSVSPPIWNCQVSKGGFAPTIINDTDWLVFDSQFAWGIPAATVTANYTAAAYTLP